MLEGFPPGLRDRFEPRRVLGKGAMGTVYLATRLSDGGEVAVKVVRERGSATLRDRFLREAKSQARLEHPHVLRIFDWGEDAGDPFLVMEVLEGRSLELGPVDYDPLAVMLEIAEGLEAVHGAGLVHRDLKPANVFLCRDGRAVLTDFGLVRDPDLTALTATGQVVGSLGYLPPEVLLGERAGPRDHRRTGTGGACACTASGRGGCPSPRSSWWPWPRAETSLRWSSKSWIPRGRRRP